MKAARRNVARRTKFDWRRRAQLALLACVCVMVSWSAPSAADVPIHPSNASVYVAGREVKFDRLAIAYNDPVAPAGDTGVRTLLQLVDAQISWQPGTRFAAVTRADGTLITLTVGSAALSVGGKAVAMPFAPFYRDSDLYVPLLPLAKALQLGVRGFKGGYVFVPQIVSIDARTDARRTIVQMVTSAPAAYRSAYDARAHVLTISFPGFGTDASGTFALSGRDGLDVRTSEDGPPGYPTTTIAIDLRRGTKFAAHRAADVLAVDAVLARNEAALRFNDRALLAGHVARTSPSTPAPATPAPATPAPSTAVPVPTASPSMHALAIATASTTPVPTAHPLRINPTPVATASSNAPPNLIAPTPSTAPSESPPEPVLPEPTSPSPSPTAGEQKITDVSLAEVPNGGTRVTLTMSGGPVSFEWHRLDDPDNRYWIDIKGVTLVGPAQTLTSALPFVKQIYVTQFALEPERIVRIAMLPTQPIDVNIGPVAESTNQMGIEIERTPPQADAPKAGVGTVAWAVTSAPPPTRTPTQRDLIVLDPGHGGNDPGAANSAYGLVEKDLTLAISLRVRDELRRLGWRVVMTRDADYEVGDPTGADAQELQARCDTANAAGARVFVSIHGNSSVVHSLNGATTYYWRSADKAFAQVMEDAVVAATGIADAGIKRNNFYVIKHTEMPAVLVETAFLSNPHDAALLARPEFLDKIAHGITHGIMNFTGGPQAPLTQDTPVWRAR